MEKCRFKYMLTHRGAVTSVSGKEFQVQIIEIGVKIMVGNDKGLHLIELPLCSMMKI